MLQWILFTLVLLPLNTLFALEISMDSAKDDFAKYSTLHISDSSNFLCQERRDDFELVVEVVCAFSKRPARNIQFLQNDFFKVNTFIKDDTFFVSIKPIQKIKLLAKVFDFTKDDSSFNADVTLSSSWVVLGYGKALPLIEQDKKDTHGLNLPFFLESEKLPYVGSLDIKGNPVHIKKVEDVKEYLKIKQAYKNKKYEQCMDSIDEILQKYPKTLFKAELLYYKIKVYNRVKDYDNVIDYAKLYLREYSSNENIPEILSLIAKAYSQIGLNIDADYFFDRLFSEHKDSLYTEWGYIYKGQMQEASGGATQAISFYKKVLQETEDMQAASTAAYYLVNINLGVNLKEASRYAQKLIKANPQFFIHDVKESTEMMHTFVDEKRFDIAAAIATAMINEINPSYDEYEIYLKDIALWLAQTKEKQKALEALNKYIKQFPDGDYINQVEIAKDALFFDRADINATTRLDEYDKLIDIYSNDTIGNRAIYEKAKLLLELHKYNEILSMQDAVLELDAESYPDKEDIVTEAAMGLMEISLQNKACENVLVVARDYNISLSNDWDDGVFACAMKGGDFELSKKIVSKNLKNSNLELRKKWLYRYIEVAFATGSYSDVVPAAKDLAILIEGDKKSDYNQLYRYLFDSYKRLEKQKELITIMAKIEEIYGLTYKDIERYVSMLSIGSSTKDDNMVIKYAQKVVDIQNKSDSYAQSPYVEFALYQAYMNIENYYKAADTIESLNTIKLSKKERARQKYLLATVQSKLWRDADARKSYEESIEADPDSAWAELAKSALQL